jgi:hypothetical protein
MLRTTNKQVKLDLIAHVMDNFWPKNYGGGTVGLQNLVEQIDAMRHNDRSTYQTALDYVEGGSLLIYYGDARDFLRKLLQETKEEADRFSDDKVWHLYCHLCARTIANCYESRQLELERLA